MIKDRDRIYGGIVARRLRAMGIRDKPTAPVSPWQNEFAERLIGSIRREYLDHIVVFGGPPTDYPHSTLLKTARQKEHVRVSGAPRPA